MTRFFGLEETDAMHGNIQLQAEGEKTALLDAPLRCSHASILVFSAVDKHCPAQIKLITVGVNKAVRLGSHGTFVVVQSRESVQVPPPCEIRSNYNMGVVTVTCMGDINAA